MTRLVSRANAIALLCLSLVATFSGQSTAQVQNVVQDTVFTTTNQSMWQPGPQTGLTGSTFLGTTWDQKTFTFDYGLVGNDAFGVVQLQPGKAGVQIDSNLTSGNVSVQYPVKLSYSLPEEVEPGQPFSITTSWAKNPNPSLTTAGMQASASVSLVMNIKATAGAGYDPIVGSPTYSADQPGDPGSFSSPVPASLMNAHAQDVTLVDTGNLSIPLVSVGPSGANFRVAGGPFSLTATVPQLNTSGNAYTGDSIVATGNSTPPFISGNFDLVSGAVYLANALGVPIPQLSGDYGIGSLANINWTGLSSTVQLGPSLYQSFNFTPTNFPITLVTADGQTATGFVGGTFTFIAPNAPNTDLGITATTNINNNFTNNTGIVFAANLNTQALAGSMEVEGYSLFSFGPLINSNVSLYTSDPWLFPGAPEQFALGGFNNAQQDLSLHIVPEPSALLLFGLGAVLAARRARKPDDCR